MDLFAALGTAALSSVINCAVIVLLYTFWIIPQIVSKVRDELLDKITVWVDELKSTVTGTISDQIGDVGERIRRTISGTRANAARQMKLAEEFLNANLPDDDEDDEDAGALRDDVINQAVLRYGSSVIKTVLSKLAENDNKSTQGGIKW